MKLPNKLCNEVKVIGRQDSQLITLGMCNCLCARPCISECVREKKGERNERADNDVVSKRKKGNTEKEREIPTFSV